MDIFRNNNTVFSGLDNGYCAHKQMRISVANDAVIRVCGLRRLRGGFFDVYYAAIPVFSEFSLDDDFLNDASAAPVLFNPLSIRPDPSLEFEVLEKASGRARTAFEKLNQIGTVEDVVTFYKRETELLLDRDISAATRYYLNDAIVYLGRFDELESLLERCVTVAVKNVFQNHGITYPANGDWRRYLPPNTTTAQSEFEEELCSENEGNWQDLRILLAKKEYTVLNEKLLKNYNANKKLLSKLGISLQQRYLHL